MTIKDARDEWAMQLLGRWLLDWRLATGATQRRVAALAGIDQAHLCRIEQGKRRPSGAPLGRIIIALDWLSSGEPGDGPWARTGMPAPQAAARWGPAGRPPVVVGHETWSMPWRLPPDEPLLADDPLWARGPSGATDPLSATDLLCAVGTRPSS